MGLFDMLFKKKEKVYTCARCKREITDEGSNWIGNHRFCDQCAAPSQRTVTQQHGVARTYTCARCKKEITDEGSNWIGNHRFCSECAAPAKVSTIRHHRQEEAKDADYQARMDSARGALSPEQAYANRGFVKDEDGQWVYGKTAEDKPRATNKAICLYYEGDACQGSNLVLDLEENGNISIRDVGWWPAHPGASNGGTVTTSLPSDYFQNHTIEDFIAFLTAEKEKDFSHLKNRDDIKALFQKKTISSSVAPLRQKIISSIRKKPSETYELASLLWQDAARCFPNNYSFNWDGAWFKLNLKTGKLYADVGTYPNQFGASREDRYSLTAAQFHSKAVEFGLEKELQGMVTEEDWQALFDDRLKDEVAKALQKLDAENKKQEYEQKLLYAVTIPDSYALLQPTMELDEVRLELDQRFGSSYVLLNREEGRYKLASSYSKGVWRTLSPMEAVWAEKQVWECLNSADKTTWKSMAGGDRMTYKIAMQGKTIVESKYTMTIFKKYMDLKYALQDLAKYGSFSESEKKKLKKARC